MRKAEYLFKAEPGGFLIYVSTDLEPLAGYYESFRVFLGYLGDLPLRRIPVESATRMRDVHTHDGMLYAPARRLKRTPLWRTKDRQPLVELDPANYVIDESETRVTIVEKT